jgi:hypothetical protein
MTYNDKGLLVESARHVGIITEMPWYPTSPDRGIPRTYRPCLALRARAAATLASFSRSTTRPPLFCAGRCSGASSSKPAESTASITLDDDDEATTGLVSLMISACCNVDLATAFLSPFLAASLILFCLSASSLVRFKNHSLPSLMVSRKVGGGRGL